MRRPAAALTALTLCCALTACGTDKPTTQTTPTPEVSTSAPNPAPASSDPAQDPLYLEAVDVYQKYFAEMQKFEAAGYPTKTLPASMDAYITPDAKAMATEAINAAQARHVAPRLGQSSTLTAIAPNPGVSIAGSQISLRVCSDGRNVDIIDTSTKQPVSKGVMAYKQIHLKRSDSRLKIVAMDAKKVDACPI